MMLMTYDVSEAVPSGVEVVAEVLDPGLGALAAVGRELILIVVDVGVVHCGVEMESPILSLWKIRELLETFSNQC